MENINVDMLQSVYKSNGGIIVRKESNIISTCYSFRENPRKFLLLEPKKNKLYVCLMVLIY